MGQSQTGKNPKCPRCNSEYVTKSGKPKGKQRYKCSACNYQFTLFEMRNKPGSLKAMALALHSYGVNQSKISELLGVTLPCVHYWLMEFRDRNFMNPEAADVEIIPVSSLQNLVSNKGTKKRIVLVPVDDNTGKISGFINFNPMASAEAKSGRE